MILLRLKDNANILVHERVIQSCSEIFEMQHFEQKLLLDRAVIEWSELKKVPFQAIP